MAQSPSIIETQTVHTPLGFRFWDPVTNQQIGDSLLVTARPEEGGGPVVKAFLTASRFFAFPQLPGLETVGASSLLAVVSSPERRGFIIEVLDRQHRYQPVVFTVQLPLAEPGLYLGSTPASPPGEKPRGFCLFSAPTRAVSPGCASVRAELFDSLRQTPAAHALLEVEVGGETWFGLADEVGRVAILLPYPPSNLTLGSSPPSGPPLSQQQWPVRVRVRSEPGALRFPAQSTRPDLRSIRDQSMGLIHATLPVAGPGTPGPTLSATLNFGRDLVLRTGTQPNLWIASL